jgi:ketosteroid isomerase-like protein
MTPGIIAMSEANIAVIKTTYAAFNRGDIQALLANVEPNAEWVNYGPAAVPYFGNFTGRIADFFNAIGESTTGGSVAIERSLASGDMVINEGRYTATARGTGARIDAPIAHVFTLRDGKVTSWRGYGDTAAVLAAHTAKAASA